MIYSKENLNQTRIRMILRRLEEDLYQKMSNEEDEDIDELVYLLDDIILLKYYFEEIKKEMEDLRNDK